MTNFFFILIVIIIILIFLIILFLIRIYFEQQIAIQGYNLCLEYGLKQKNQNDNLNASGEVGNTILDMAKTPNFDKLKLIIPKTTT